MANIYARYPATSGGGGVTSLDGLTGAVTLTAGTGISITDGVGTITIASTSAGDLTLAAVGSTPNANAASLTGQVLNLQPADGTHPGVVTTAAQTFGGVKNFSANIFAANLSGTNSGDLTIGTANGLSLTGSSQVLNLALASTSTTGALSSTDWNTFNGKAAAGSYITDLTGDGAASGPGSAVLTLATVNANVGSFTYGSFTVNAKGLITAASNGTAPVTTLAAVGSAPSANGASISSNTLTLQPFDSTHPGVVTASAGGTSNFLRADGTWAAPAGSGGFLYPTTGSAYGGTNSTLSFSGTSNTIVGQGAAASLAAGTDNTIYGKGAGGTNLAANSKHTVIGSSAVIGTGQEDVVIGFSASSASTTTGTSVVIGSSAATSGTGGTAVAIGRGATSATGVAIGFGAQMTGSGIILGKNSTHGQSNSILIGNALSTSFNNTFIAGQSGSSVTPATAANQIVFGVSGGALKDLWLGQGAAAVAGTPVDISLQGTGVVTTSNQVGGNFTLSAPNGTGTGGSGKIIFRTSPVGSTGAVANTITQVGQVDNTGAWTLGATSASPAHLVNGSLGFNGSSSGTISVKTQAAAGTYNFNLPITAGSPGQALLSQGGGSTAMTWGSPIATAAFNVVAKTTTYAAVANDYISATASGASYSVTLPTAVGINGQSIVVTRPDLDLAHVITVATTSSQTIAIAGKTPTSVGLYTQGELFYFTSDGANWICTEHTTNTAWSSSVATTITTTGTANAKGTNSTDSFIWRRIGDFAECSWTYVQTGAGTAGSGNYKLNSIVGLEVDTTYHPLFTTTAGAIAVNTLAAPSMIDSDVNIVYSTNWMASARLYVFSTTSFQVGGNQNFTSNTNWGLSVGDFGNTTMSIAVTARWKVANWLP